MATENLPQNSCIVYILRRSDRSDPYDVTLPAPFYVGIGKTNRPYFHSWEARRTKASTHKLNIIRAVERHGGMISVEYVAEDVSRDVAGMIERQLIHFYGRHSQGGLLANQTDGGEGVCGLPPETRERIRQAHVGKQLPLAEIQRLRTLRVGVRLSAESIRKRSESVRGSKRSPEARANMVAAQRFVLQRGKKPVDWTPERRARVSAWATGRKYPAMAEANRGAGNPCARGLWVEDHFYGTVKEACEALGINKTTLYQRLLRNDPRYRYETGTEDLGTKLSGSNSASARAIIVNGVRYATVDEAILRLGIGKTTLYRRIRSGVYKVEYETVPSERQTTARAMKVNGVAYPSVNDAIVALQIGDTTFYRRVKSGVYIIEPLEL